MYANMRESVNTQCQTSNGTEREIVPTHMCVIFARTRLYVCMQLPKLYAMHTRLLIFDPIFEQNGCADLENSCGNP